MEEARFALRPVQVSEVAHGSLGDWWAAGLHAGKEGGLCREGVPLLLLLNALREYCGCVLRLHSAGLSHHGIKPSNALIALRGGRLVARAADFGLAFCPWVSHLLGDVHARPPPGGTMGYFLDFSPKDLEAAGAEDSTAMAVTLLVMLTGNGKPFKGADELTLLPSPGVALTVLKDHCGVSTDSPGIHAFAAAFADLRCAIIVCMAPDGCIAPDINRPSMLDIYGHLDVACDTLGKAWPAPASIGRRV